MSDFAMVSGCEKGAQCNIGCHGTLVTGGMVSNYPHPLLGSEWYPVAPCKVHSDSSVRVRCYLPFQQAVKYWKKSGRAESFWKTRWNRWHIGKEATGTPGVGAILCVATFLKTCHQSLPCFLRICFVTGSLESLLKLRFRSLQVFKPICKGSKWK